MGDRLQNGNVRSSHLVCASQVAREAAIRQSQSGVRYATYGETGVADVELDRILEAVPKTITAALKANTYYFVPLAMREHETFDLVASRRDAQAESTMVSDGYTEELSEAAICHRNVELGPGDRGVFISTRLMGDRFALSFEFFINVAHAFVDEVGVPKAFEDVVWKQALENVRGETSADAWESRNVTFGRPANAQPESLQPMLRRNRGSAFSFAAKKRPFTGISAKTKSTGSSVDLNASTMDALQQTVNGPIDEKERELYMAAAFSDAVGIYLLSLALDFDYTELREREYPLLVPAALAARLRTIAELYPPNEGYEFDVRYRRKA
jgi:hypothetical protein